MSRNNFVPRRSNDWVVKNGRQFFPEAKPWPKGVELRDGQYGIATDRGFHRILPGDWIAVEENGDAFLYRPNPAAVNDGRAIG